MADHVARAEALLGDTVDRPAARARRIGGLYAAFFLEDPLLHSWFGLASFVARQVAWALQPGTPLDDALADGNLRIYRALVPNLLRFRDGLPAQDGLEPGFAELRAAGELAQVDLPAAFARAAKGLRKLTEEEQGRIAQGVFAELTDLEAAALRRVFLFRMGWDSAAPVVKFDGDDPRDPAQRLFWLRTEILPKWEEARLHRMEWLRADADRHRRDVGIRLADLPPRAVPAPGRRVFPRGWMVQAVDAGEGPRADGGAPAA